MVSVIIEFISRKIWSVVHYKIILLENIFMNEYLKDKMMN